MTTSVEVTNIKPYTSFGFSTIIPARTSRFLQELPQPANLDPNSYHYISKIIIRVDTSGIYNIPVDETFLLGGVSTNVTKGFYSNADLVTLANLNFSPSGPNANRFSNNQTLQFSANSNLIYVLGYQAFGTSLIPVSTIAGDTVNSTGDLDFMLLQSDLVQIGSSFNNNFLTALPIEVAAPGPAETTIQSMELPLRTHNFSSIDWSIFTAFGKPYIIETPIIIFTQITSIKKKQ